MLSPLRGLPGTLGNKTGWQPRSCHRARAAPALSALPLVFVVAGVQNSYFSLGGVANLGNQTAPSRVRHCPTMNGREGVGRLQP